jgi:hypothetical protein
VYNRKPIEVLEAHRAGAAQAPEYALSQPALGEMAP